MSKRMVITGPTGTIGMAMIKRCINEGIEVLAICRKGSARIGRIPQNPLVQVIEANLDELREVDIKQKYDLFYHLAWDATIGDGRNDMKRQLQNVWYALDAVELADRLGCHSFIGAGSQAEYGRTEGKLSDKTATFPENGYGMAKLCAGQMTRAECRRRGIHHIWTRILSVYGPYDGRATMISSTIRSLLSGRKPPLTAGGQQWDYLYSDDAAEALLLLGTGGKGGEVYCIGSGTARPLVEYVETLRDCIDPALPLGIGEVPYSENQVMHLCADIGKLSQDTGFVPKTDFRSGIKNTVEWLKAEEGL